MVGLVETSIGKMVPIMTAEEKKRDPLLVYAEAYNTLILDKKGFKNPIPQVKGLAPKENIKAYVQRKSFIHNLGHAMTAYVEYIENKGYTYTWEVMKDKRLRMRVKEVVCESGNALINAYPEEFNSKNIEEHVEDLLDRFSNKYLGDTIYRVGRDIQRKLAYDDRIIGAMIFDMTRGIEPIKTAFAAAAACFFKKTDIDGLLFSKDKEFQEKIFPEGIDYILKNVCNLSENKPIEKKIINLIKSKFFELEKTKKC